LLLALLLLAPEAPALDVPEVDPLLESEVPVLTPSACSSAAKSACRVCRALCTVGGAVLPDDALVVVLVAADVAGVVAVLTLLVAGAPEVAGEAVVVLGALLVEDADGRP